MGIGGTIRNTENNTSIEVLDNAQVCFMGHIINTRELLPLHEDGQGPIHVAWEAEEEEK